MRVGDGLDSTTATNDSSRAEFRLSQRESYVRYEDVPLETRDGQAVNVEFVSNIYQVNGDRVAQCQ